MSTRVKYRGTLDDGEKATFIAAVKDDGIEPRVRCPLCRTRRQYREARFVYCDKHHHWGEAGRFIRCHTCRVQYVVSTKPDCCREAA